MGRLLKRRAVLGEMLGTGLLLYMIVGSGIAAERLSLDPAVTLFTHAAVVGASLTVLIWMFGPVSGAHFNPVVTVALWRSGLVGRDLIPLYVAGQVGGGVAGAVLANVTFKAPVVAMSANTRGGLGTGVSEVIVTFVLVLLIVLLVRSANTTLVAPAVGAWVAAAVFGTSSTGFANPAVTVSRVITDTYTGIGPSSVPGFVIAQTIGMALAVGAGFVLKPTKETIS